MRVEANFRNKKSNVKINIPVFSYKEGDLFVYYCPVLDLFGYGEIDSKARESFVITLSEFLSYTINKGTIFEELKKLGWKVNKKKRKYSAPDFAKLLRDNEQFTDIVENKDYQKVTEEIEIPETV